MLPGALPSRIPYGVKDMSPCCLCICGVVTISSPSSRLLQLSSSEELLSEASLVIAVVDPIERGLNFSLLDPTLKPCIRLGRGDSHMFETVEDLLEGILIALWVKIGEESGVDLSGSVEWCILVRALAKSMPLECRGSTVVGDP